MLAARLKRLETAEVITRTKRGTGSAGYELTARGRDLAHALGELMLWGLHLPEMYRPDDQSRAVWLAMNMQSALDRARDSAPAGTYAFHIGDEHFWLHVGDDADQPSTLRDGTPPHRADATLTLTPGDFFALARGASLHDPDTSVEGDRHRLTRLLQLFTVANTLDD